MARTYYPFPTPQLAKSTCRPDPSDTAVVSTYVVLGYFLDSKADSDEPEFLLATEYCGDTTLEILPEHIQ